MPWTAKLRQYLHRKLSPLTQRLQRPASPATPTWTQLNNDKTAARQQLLTQPPQQAQTAVNQILHPELWEIVEGQDWCDRIPRRQKPTWLSDNS